MPRLNASPAEDIDFIERGDVMSFVEVVDNTWFKVSVDGTEGYVLRGDVTSQENFDSQDTKLQDIKAEKEDGMEEEYTVAVTTALRTGDADRYRPLKTLRRTNVVTYLGTTANGWFKVKDAEGTEGFVNRTEVTKNENMDGNNPVEKAIEMELDEDQELDVVLNSSIRTQPGNQYAILDELERNEVVTYKGTALQGNKQWFKVELTNGSWGYVDRGHVTKAPEIEDLVVNSVSAINDITVDYGGELELPETVTATLNDEEATEVTLDVAWTEDEDYDNKEAGDYTFEYVLSIQEDEELEFELPEELAEGAINVTVKTLLETATDAVEKAEESLLQADIDAALGLVGQVENLVEKAKLQVRLNNLKPKITAIVDKVNKAKTQFALEEALQQNPLTGYDRDNINGYQAAIAELDDEFTTIDEIQAMIDDVNDEKLAQEVEELIAALPIMSELELEDKADVEEAGSAYDALTDDQKELVEKATVQKLRGAQSQIKKLEDAKLAQEVEKLIAALPIMSELELEDKADVEEAGSAYDALTDDQKELVEKATVQKLRGAQSQIKKLEATPFIEEAKALPALVTIEEMNEDELAEVTKGIEAAKETYEALSDELKELEEVKAQKRFLTNRENAVTARLKELEDQAEALTKATAAVEAAENHVLETNGNKVDKQDLLNKAESLLEKVVEGKEKAALQERIDAVQLELDSTVFTATELKDAVAQDSELETVILGADIKISGQLFVRNENITIDGNDKTLTSTATEDSKHSAIKIDSLGSGATIKDLTVKATGYEGNVLYVSTADNVEITNNTFESIDNKAMGVYFDQNSGGILSENTIVGRKGVGVDTTKEVTIANNDISFTNIGIELIDGNGANAIAIDSNEELSNNTYTQYTLEVNEFNKVD